MTRGRALSDFFSAPFVSIAAPPQAVVRTRSLLFFAGLYVTCAGLSILQELTMVRLSFAWQDTGNTILVQIAYKVGISSAVAAGIIIPFLLPATAGFLPWLMSEFWEIRSSFSQHLSILLIALAPGLVVKSVVAVIFGLATNRIFDSSFAILVTSGPEWLMPLIQSLDFFWIWALGVAIACYRTAFKGAGKRATILAVVGMGGIMVVNIFARYALTR